MTAQTRRATLAEHDGMSFKDPSRMAHPCDLVKWSEQGLIKLDMQASCFRLTEKGRLVARIEQIIA